MNVPLLIVVGLVLLVSLVYLSATSPLLVAAVVLILSVVGVVFSKRIRKKQEKRDSRKETLRSSPSAVPAEGPVNFTGLTVAHPVEPSPTSRNVEVRAAEQPAPVPAKELSLIPALPSAPQTDWTAECDLVVAALISLKIPKREAINLVRQTAGNTVDELLRGALKIRGQGRFP